MCKERNSSPPHLQVFCSQWICFPVPFLFLQVIEGKLAPFLGKVIKFATSHVYSCSLCSQKGFICEICNNGEILYPFEDISTSRYRISCLINVYLNVSHAILFVQTRPTCSQVLYFCLLPCIRFPLFLEDVWFSVFISNPPHYLYPRWDNRIAKKHCLALSYRVTKSVRIHF